MAIVNNFHESHPGHLPVRVLKYSLLDAFEKADKSFRQESLNAILYDGLNPVIGYDIRRRPAESPYINPDSQIVVNEPYFAFLWCLCYLLIVLYDDFYSQVNSDDTINFKIIDTNNPEVIQAISLFNYGVSLFYNWSEWDKDLPNPESFDDNNWKIERANGLYINAVKFVLAHEYAHHALSHELNEANLVSKESELLINEELMADRYSIQLLRTGALESNQDDLSNSIKIGTLIGVGSILFPHTETSGGENHPDCIDRINNALEEMQFDVNDVAWTFSVYLIHVWACSFNSWITWPITFDNPKDFYYKYIANLRALL